MSGRWALAVVTALVVAGILWGSARPVVLACFCSSGVETDEGMREALAYSDLVILAEVPGSGTRSESSDHVRLEVKAVYKGATMSQVSLVQTLDWGHPGTDFGPDEVSYSGSCEYRVLGKPGQQYYLFLSEEDGGLYEASGCSSFTVREPLYMYDPTTGAEYVDRLERVSGGAVIPDSDYMPWIPDTVAAVLGPLVFLAGAAFVWGRKGRAG